MASKNIRQKASSSKAAANASTAPPTISIRWLAAALVIVILSASVCAWCTLCFLFWQGSWQLLYHPSAAVVRTPASAGLAFESIGFATDPAGRPQLHGWWIPKESDGRYTAIYLHGAEGSLGDTVDSLDLLHTVGLNVFAIDYRGYGQSRFKHPSEATWREDAESAITYLTGTRHVSSQSILLVGKDLGANLALELAASHPELGGVLLNAPIDSPVNAVFNDPRARLVPAPMLVKDRYELNAPSTALRIPSLWVYFTAAKTAVNEDEPLAYQNVRARKSLVWLGHSPDAEKNYLLALARWVDELPVKPKP